MLGELQLPQAAVQCLIHHSAHLLLAYGRTKEKWEGRAATLPAAPWSDMVRGPIHTLVVVWIL